MSTKLISKFELNPIATEFLKDRLSNRAYDNLMADINQYLIDNKDKGEARIIFGNNDLIGHDFLNSFIYRFHDETICDSTAKRFKKELKKSDYEFYHFHQKYQYWYHEFTFSWR